MRTECGTPVSASTPTPSSCPKCQFCPFLAWWASGSRAPSAFLVDDGLSMKVASTMVPRLTASPPSAADPKAEETMASPTPQRSSRWRNLHRVVASGTSKGATPTKERIVAESQTWSSHSRSERPKQTCTMYMRSSTRSSTLGLPIAGSAPLAPASAPRASLTRASQASQGQDLERRSRNRERLVSRFRPMPISTSENVSCAMRIPPT